jgi:hypothetical protein
MGMEVVLGHGGSSDKAMITYHFEHLSLFCIFKKKFNSYKLWYLFSFYGKTAAKDADFLVTTPREDAGTKFWCDE